jgi:glycosyltransferase involved in cell wall biosynthesis
MSPDEPTDISITYSLIIPVYKNEANISSLLEAVEDLSEEFGCSFEAIFVVDGSPDRSYMLLSEKLPEASFASQLLALSTNFGSFSAIRSGLESARGRFMAVMAADLQEPLDLVRKFFRELAADRADVIFGSRVSRSDGLISNFFSRLFWKAYKSFVIKDIPEGGIDVFGCNDIVKRELLRFKETNSSLIAQLFWIGFRRSFIPYERRERIHGQSAWKFNKKLRYMLDSIFSFSDLPIMILLWIGLFGCLVSVLFGLVILIFRLSGLITQAGYTPIMLALFFFGSLIMTSQGIIGCYLWRTSENSKKRPLSIVASKKTFNGSPKRKT